MKTKMKKAVVQNKIAENLDKHIKEYRLATEKYCEEMEREYLKLVDQISARLSNKEYDKYSFHIDRSTTKPQSYEKHYHTAIDMLHHHQDKYIELDYISYKSYILDEWDWKEDFRNTTAKYLSA